MSSGNSALTLTLFSRPVRGKYLKQNDNRPSAIKMLTHSGNKVFSKRKGTESTLAR